MSIASPIATEVVRRSVVNSAPPKILRIEEDEAYWNSIREHFPIVHDQIYMNNGTMGPSPREVTERVTKRIEHVDSTGDYGGDYEGIRAAVGKVINATGDEIAFTHNVSEAISIIASGIDLKEGDEVILTDQEHAGNAIPWLARAKRDKIVVKFVTLAPDDATILERMEAAITPRTRAIAVPHVTCTTGHVLPIKQISALAHKHGAWMMADGAHPPGMMLVDMKDLGVDAYTSCGHKWLCGPKGLGFLYITADFREHVIPTWSGGEADKHWDYEGHLDFLPTASRYDFATQNFALFDGLHAAVDWMSAIGFEKIDARLKYLTSYMRTQLTATIGNHFHYLTPPTSVTGLTTIKLHDMECQLFANTLMGRHKVRTRVVHESALDANRISAHIYTSPKDIDLFIEGAAEVLMNPPPKG
jgi:L-cysteine/cystine lyase